jgi:hypothetical protein
MPSNMPRAAARSPILAPNLAFLGTAALDIIHSPL